MADDVETSGRGRAFLWIGILGVGLPLIYILSIGPAVFTVEKAHSRALEKFVDKFYAPVEWLDDQDMPLAKLLDDYIAFWERLAH